MKKKDIRELKHPVKPPDTLIVQVCEAVCILLGETNLDWRRDLDASWKSARKMLAILAASNMASLKEFDKELEDGNVPVARLRAVQKYVDNEDFEPEAVGNKSRAARSLCMWVRAMHDYGMYLAEKRGVEPVDERDAARKASRKKRKKKGRAKAECCASKPQVDKRDRTKG